jgi:hypothetical protein
VAAFAIHKYDPLERFEVARGAQGLGIGDWGLRIGPDRLSERNRTLPDASDVAVSIGPTVVSHV